MRDEIKRSLFNFFLFRDHFFIKYLFLIVSLITPIQVIYFFLVLIFYSLKNGTWLQSVLHLLFSINDYITIFFYIVRRTIESVHPWMCHVVDTSFPPKRKLKSTAAAFDKIVGDAIIGYRHYTLSKKMHNFLQILLM